MSAHVTTQWWQLCFILFFSIYFLFLCVFFFRRIFQYYPLSFLQLIFKFQNRLVQCSPCNVTGIKNTYNNVMYSCRIVYNPQINPCRAPHDPCRRQACNFIIVEVWPSVIPEWDSMDSAVYPMMEGNMTTTWIVSHQNRATLFSTALPFL
jgi:hypothetical protein